VTKTVLLIGGTGFAARHFLAGSSGSDHRVVSSSRRAGDSDLVCDLLEPGSVEAALEEVSPDVVLNLAGAASVAASFRDPRTTFEVNALGTLNLLDAASRVTPLAHVICVSSGEVYGTVPEPELPATEERRPQPASPYAASKVSMELICDQYRRANELRVTVVRAFNHTGPGQSDSFAVSSFARQIAEAELQGADHVTLSTGNLDVHRDFTDVRDVVRAYRTLIEHETIGTFNACSGESTRLGRLLDYLGAATSLTVETSVEADRLRPGEPPVLYGSRERLREATGWRPEIPLRRTVADLLDWWRERVRA
jgi:GDP-4-dehydro-6-deoxy-D-mannose reductase